LFQKFPALVYLSVMHTFGVGLLALGLGLAAIRLNAADSSPESSTSLISHVRQLQQLSFHEPAVERSIRLDGTVWWINPLQGKLVLHDSSGMVELELDLQGRRQF
jgi:hypothetical protein